MVVTGSTELKAITLMIETPLTTVNLRETRLRLYKDIDAIYSLAGSMVVFVQSC